MSHLGILLLCFQACLVQHVFSQCLSVKAPVRNIATPALGVSSPARAPPGSAIGPLGYGGWTGRPWGGYGKWAGYGGRSGYGQCGPWAFGGSGNGNMAVDGGLPVAGNTAVGGQMPIVGAVQFSGTAPAAGTVIITGTCGCGCGTHLSTKYY